MYIGQRHNYRGRVKMISMGQDKEEEHFGFTTSRIWYADWGKGMRTEYMKKKLVRFGDALCWIEI